MKILITEEQYNNIFARRRMNEIWSLVIHSYPYMYPCEFDREHLIDAICDEIFSVVWFDDWDESVAEIVQEFIRIYYRYRILDMWDQECKKPEK